MQQILSSDFLRRIQFSYATYFKLLLFFIVKGEEKHRFSFSFLFVILRNEKQQPKYYSLPCELVQNMAELKHCQCKEYFSALRNMRF
jgi:hypothetical protein